jgi:TonB family protein
VPYDYAGCSFDLNLGFYHDRLDKVFLSSVGNTSPCAALIENELTLRYGAPNRVITPPPDTTILRNARHGELGGPVTSVLYNSIDSYNSGCCIEVTFSETDDGSGRRADTARYFCQSIAVAITDAKEADGTANPVLDPNLPDLGCEYPTLSVRLLEQGSVTLGFHVLADGSVADIQLIDPDHATRLSEVAVNIAHKTLRFLPAMKDGRPVEVERRIVFTFKIIRLPPVPDHPFLVPVLPSAPN